MGKDPTTKGLRGLRLAHASSPTYFIATSTPSSDALLGMCLLGSMLIKSEFILAREADSPPGTLRERK